MMSRKDEPVFTVFLLLSITRGFGMRAENKQFPFSSLIVTNYNTTSSNINEWICSGAVMSDKFVLTAGLCIKGVKKFRVKLGAINVGSSDYNYKLEYTYDHVMWTDPLINRDLALIRINPRCTFTPDIQPVIQPVYLSTYKANDSGIVAGWGEIRTDQHELHWTPARVVDNVRCCSCRNPGIDNNVTICAERDDIDEITGSIICTDAGSSLLDQTGTLMGISLQSCRSGEPQLFAKIGWYYSWMSNVELNETRKLGEAN